MDIPLKVGLVYGSARPGRFCDTVADWVAERVWSDSRFVLDPIDPAAEDQAPLVRRIGEADGFIVVTPEYNHSLGRGGCAIPSAPSGRWLP